MVADHIAKLYVVHAPDTPGPSRLGHGITVITTAVSAMDALIQAPLSLDPRTRDQYDWGETHAWVHEAKVNGVRVLADGKVRYTVEVDGNAGVHPVSRPDAR